MNRLILLTAVVPVVLFGLIAGFFYAFSVDVMPGFDLLPPHQAISAMQAVNSAVRNPVFFVTFFLTPVFGLLAAYGIFRASANKAALLMAAAVVVYLGFAFLPTILVNVPMNEALGQVDASKAVDQAKRIWDGYAPKWTFWNTIRTIASTVALGLSVLSVFHLGRYQGERE